MSPTVTTLPRFGRRYGAFSFASVIVTCFAQFLFMNRIDGGPGRLALTFVLGALYAALGMLDHDRVRECDAGPNPARFLVMSAVVTALVFVSPARGFFGIIVLPLVAMAIFDFPWRVALAAVLYLFGISIAVFWYYYGSRAVPEALASYLAAFVFTGIFTAITKQALTARDRAQSLTAELESANQQLQAYAVQAGDLATTRERNRVAREIHDGVGHYLTVVKTQLDAAAGLIDSRPDEARASVVKAAQLTGDALDDVRRSVGALRTDAARPPLPESLRALITESGLPATVRLKGAARPLPPAAEHALFRSAQEALTNIRKHAAATAAEVLLDFRAPGRVTLTITDNGQGANGAPVDGFGLRGIAERIELLGGRVESGNRPGGGFALTIEVPA